LLDLAEIFEDVERNILPGFIRNKYINFKTLRKLFDSPFKKFPSDYISFLEDFPEI